MRAVLAVVLTDRVDRPAASEFLRVLAALRAVGRSVSLVETGPGTGALRAGGLDPEGDRYLAALEEDGVVPQPAGDLGARIESAEALLVLADPDRAGTPDLLCLPRGKRPSASDLAALPAAGQVLLEA